MKNSLKNKQVTYIHNQNKCTIEFFIACMINGLEYIHRNNIIHRDLKPENLVLDKNGYVRITDFGIAKVIKPNNAGETSGTPGYMSPEVICGQNHSFPTDFFAIGVMGYEFMFGKRPYIGNSRKTVKEAILQKQAKISLCDLPLGWSIKSADFINNLLIRKDEKRLGYKKGAEELKNDMWFGNFNWYALNNKTLKSPFILNNIENFDKSYCEAKESLEASTLERYQSYLKEEDFAKKFEGYTFYNEDEIYKIINTRKSSSINYSSSISTKKINEHKKKEIITVSKKSNRENEHPEMKKKNNEQLNTFKINDKLNNTHCIIVKPRSRNSVRVNLLQTKRTQLLMSFKSQRDDVGNGSLKKFPLSPKNSNNFMEKELNFNNIKGLTYSKSMRVIQKEQRSIMERSQKGIVINKKKIDFFMQNIGCLEKSCSVKNLNDYLPALNNNKKKEGVKIVSKKEELNKGMKSKNILKPINVNRKNYLKKKVV